MATSHGEGGGAGGAGGALVAISAANAEVVRPATISNGKATRFITSPFVIPVEMAALAPPPANPISAMIRATPNLRGFESSQVFQFCYETAKIKSRANAAFLCFRWKTSHFVKKCGGWDTV